MQIAFLHPPHPRGPPWGPPQHYLLLPGSCLSSVFHCYKGNAKIGNFRHQGFGSNQNTLGSADIRHQEIHLVCSMFIWKGVELVVLFVILKNIFKILTLLSPSIQLNKLWMCAGQNIECEWSKSRLYTGGNYSGNGTLVRPYSNFLLRLCAFLLALWLLPLLLWTTR